jgi:molybdopterin-guanine dinucleotide biosynthesis protein A
MGRDKALIGVGGEPLFLRVARTMAEVADPVLLAPGARGRLGDTGFADVEDERPDAGPLGGILAGLTASPHPLTAVVAVDMPFASASVLALLASRAAGYDAVVPLTADGLQPLHAVYAASALEPLRAALADGTRGVLVALERLRVDIVGPEVWGAADPTGGFAFNLNRPEDLATFGSPATRKGARRRPSDERDGDR